MRLPQFFSSRLVLIGLAIVLLGLGALEFNQWQKRRQIQQEIDHIVTQQQEYEQKNRDLVSSLDLLNSSDYKEKIAREQLNLKKDGEIVVNFSEAEQPAGEKAEAKQSNPQKWWQYFFNKN